MKLFLFHIYILLTVIFSSADVNTSILEKIYKTNPTEAILHADSLLISNSNLQKKSIANIKYYQAIAYQNNNNHRKALSLFNEIIKSTYKSSDRHIRILLLMSNSNAFFNNHTAALNQAIEALYISKENKLHSLTASSNSAISYIHYINKDYQKALEFLQNSVELFKKENDSTMLSSTYNNIAIIYKNIEQYDNAIDYNMKSLAISEFQKDNKGISKTYSNIGRIYVLLNKSDQALSYYQKALQINISSSIKNSIPYRNIGDVFQSKFEFQKAEQYYLKALDIEKKNNNITITKVLYSNLLKTAIQLNNFEKALQYQTKFDSISKIDISNQNIEKINMLENQHRLYKNKKELSQLKKINTKNKIILGVISFLLLALVLFWVQLVRNKRLKLSQEKMHLEQKVLRSQMNPHFIFNVLSAIQTSLLDNDPIKSATYLSRFAKLIRQNFDFISQNNILLSEEIEAITNYLETQKIRYQDKFTYEINVFSDIDIHSVEIPPLLIQPFVENAIEHGFKGMQNQGIIIINISKGDNRTLYEINDNGKGFEKLEKDSKPHAIEILKKRLKLLNNNDESITIVSNEKGTKIKFSIKQ